MADPRSFEPTAKASVRLPAAEWMWVAETDSSVKSRQCSRNAMRQFPFRPLFPLVHRLGELFAQSVRISADTCIEFPAGVVGKAMAKANGDKSRTQERVA
jgi:hypothetical protein